MTMADARPPVAAGETAPAFALPAVAGEARISLEDYRGRSPLFLALMLGLWCPFCRRQIAELGKLEGKLKALGVESLVVVATPPDNARLYFKYRPTAVRLASDPELTTHRAYGLPKPVPTPEMLQAMDTIRINPTGELPEPLPISQAGKVLHEKDGYRYTAADESDVERQWPQLKGFFMIDRAGIVRLAEVECSREGLAGIGKLPAEQELLEAARGL